MSQSQRDSHERNFVISTACSGNLPLGGMMTDDDNMWMMVGETTAHTDTTNMQMFHTSTVLISRTNISTELLHVNFVFYDTFYLS